MKMQMAIRDNCTFIYRESENLYQMGCNNYAEDDEDMLVIELWRNELDNSYTYGTYCIFIGLSISWQNFNVYRLHALYPLTLQSSSCTCPEEQ